MIKPFKVAKLNINGLRSTTKMRMLNDFLRRQDIDVALLQEVTHNDLDSFRGCLAIVNEGTTKKGTAMIIKEGLSICNIKRLPPGRGIAGMFKDIWLKHIYAPSGAENRHEREAFFTNDITYLLPANTTEMLLAGDFNCVVSPKDCTAKPNFSKASLSPIKGMALHDIWETQAQRPKYTHYTNGGATRRDRISTTDSLQNHKQGAEKIATVFSDLFAVIARMTYASHCILRRSMI